NGEGDPGTPGEPAPDGEETEEPTVPATTVPAVRSSTIPLASIVVAVVVLVLGGVGLGRALARPKRRAVGPATPPPPVGPDAPSPPREPSAPPPPVGPAAAPAPVEATERSAAQPPVESVAAAGPRRIDRWTLELLLEVGRALIDSGDAVGNVHEVLRRIATVNGAPDIGSIILPTALIVSIPQGDSVETEVAPAGQERLRLDQVEEVERVVTAAEEGRLTPAEGIAAIAAAREMPPPSSNVARSWGYVLFTLGLAMILRAGLLELLVAAGLGVAVGVLQLRTERLRASYRVFLPVVAAFGVATVVFGLGRFLGDLSLFPPIVAPLVAFLPGAVLTTAVFELSTGHLLSGSSRLVAGMLQLVLLGLGIVAGAELLGIPAAQVSGVAGGALGVLQPWLGVAIFGVGVVVFHGVRRASLPWILLVLFLAYAGQVLGGLFFGATLSAFFGALVMTPVTVFAAAQPSGPPALVSFLPGFWLLVPGALGLAGITSILDEDRVEGIASLTTMGASMIGIALGVLLGMTVGAELVARLTRRTGPARRPLSHRAK
ncbi:MAG: threonine/serine exporter family protein, partial [Nitriliruptoraceae bacterium]